MFTCNTTPDILTGLNKMDTRWSFGVRSIRITTFKIFDQSY